MTVVEIHKDSQLMAFAMIEIATWHSVLIICSTKKATLLARRTTPTYLGRNNLLCYYCHHTQ